MLMKRSDRVLIRALVLFWILNTALLLAGCAKKPVKAPEAESAVSSAAASEAIASSQPVESTLRPGLSTPEDLPTVPTLVDSAEDVPTESLSDSPEDLSQAAP